MENQEKENQKQALVPLVPMEEQLSIVEQIARVAHNLESGSVIDVDYASDYWTPQAPLESKKLIFMGIQERLVDDIANPNNKRLLPTAFFVEKVKQGDTETLRRVCNASKKLLGVITDANIQVGTPLLVSYLGKVKNKTNQFLSDTWSVKPIKIQ